MPHPDEFSRLVALVLGELPGPEADALAARIAASPDLARTFEGVRATVEALRIPDEPPPAWLVERVKAGFASRTATADAEGWRHPALRAARVSWLDQSRRVIAGLVFDSESRAALAGFRSGGGAPRHMSFESELGEIDVQVSPAPPAPAGPPAPAWVLRAQIATAQDAPAATAMALCAGDAIVCERPVDEHGQSRLEAPRGSYELLIAVGDRIIVAPGLPVG